MECPYRQTSIDAWWVIGDVTSLSFSPNGHTLASRSGDNSIRLWDSYTGKHNSRAFRQHPVHSILCRWMMLATGGGSHHVGNDDYAIRLWDARTGSLFRTFVGHTLPIQSVAFAPDDSMLASAGEDRHIRIWDGRTGKALHSLRGHTGAVTSMLAR